MYISKIYAQPKVYFGSESDNTRGASGGNTTAPEGNLEDALDASANVGKSTVKYLQKGELERRDAQGRLTYTRRIEDGKITDTHYTNVNAPEVVDYIEYSPVQIPGEPEDKSRVVIAYWEDGKTSRAMRVYDKTGKLVDSVDYDREESSEPEERFDRVAYQ